MFEVELKAEISSKQYARIEDGFSQFKVNESTYTDVYYDHHAGAFLDDERELRIRKITYQHEEKCLLTYKDKPFDEQSKSKPEYEVGVDDMDTMKTIIEKLGYVADITFVKICKNYKIVDFGYEFALTLVFMEELEKSFVEIEIQEEKECEIDKVKEALFQMLDLLKIDRRDVTSGYYTDAVRMVRKKSC